MRYVVRKSYVEIVGTIWMPAVMRSLRIDLGQWEIDQIANRIDASDPACAPVEDWRDALEDWLATHSGDFRSVYDFTASIEHGDATIDIPWASEDGEIAYHDTLAECE